ADGAQSSRVPVPLPDDPYVVVRQAQLVDTKTKSDPEKAPSEVEELQSVGSRVPLMGKEFKAFEPIGTRTDSSLSSASLESTKLLSLDHLLTHVSPTPTPTQVSFHRRITRMIVRTQPTLSPGMSARIAKAAALSLSSFRKSEEDELGEEDTEEDEEDESLNADDERVRAVSVVDAAMSEPLGLGYGAAMRRTLELIEEIAPSTYEGVKRVSAFRQPTLVTWVDPEDDKVYTDVLAYAPPAAPVQTPPSHEWSLATISIDEDQFIEIGAQLELYGSILHDHTQRLNALPPTLVKDIDRDVRELYNKSGVVRDEIFLQRYMFRSLKREQERTVVTFGALWRPVLALEEWVAMQPELQKMRGRVAVLEQEIGRREP
nr:hypothetical protein [Tanacetum cinerariifolium]